MKPSGSPLIFLLQTALLTLTLIALPSTAGEPRQTIYVEKGKVFTAAGEPLVMRGFNEMFVWSQDKTGERWLPEMAKSGANAVRLVWDHGDKKPEDLVALIERSIAHKMVAIPECHNATGKWGIDLQACVAFWNHPVVRAAIEKNRRWTILNIANEAGDHDISDEDFLATYSQAIKDLRHWGYTVPIMVDASIWGQNIDQLLRVGPALQKVDPLQNIIFSTHSYWPADKALENYRKVATAADKLGIAIIIGEGPSVTRVGQCDDPTPLPYLEGMKILHEHNVGWLNWSWGGMKNGDCDNFRYFDITQSGEFGKWQHQPGAEIVAHSDYSVMQTSLRPASFYPDAKVRVSGVYLMMDKSSLSIGETLAFNVLIAPINATNSGYRLQLTGDNESVKLDEKNHRVSALKAGEVTLEVITDDGQLRWKRQISVK